MPYALLYLCQEDLCSAHLHARSHSVRRTDEENNKPSFHRLKQVDVDRLRKAEGTNKGGVREKERERDKERKRLVGQDTGNRGKAFENIFFFFIRSS